MATIYNLSKEILLLIYEKLEKDDLLKCKGVCRAWHSLAHAKLLNQVTFKKISTIQHFIASFDNNPNALFLDAVKKINICGLDKDEKDFQFGKENIEKLFLRFPKLEQVKFHDSLRLLDEFDDEVCKSFEQIHSVEVDVKNQLTAHYYASLKKLQQLVTSIRISKNEARRYIEHEFRSVHQFITSFSRLEKFQAGFFINFQQWLAIFAELPRLTTLNTGSNIDDQNGFMEAWVMKSTEAEKIQLFERLSRIHDLSYHCFERFNLNSVKFIAKYMTGLSKLLLTGTFNKSWTNTNQLIFCSTISDLVHTISQCTLRFKSSQATLKEYLPIITNNVFQKNVVPTRKDTPRRCLRLNLREQGQLAKLEVLANQSQRIIEISMDHDGDIESFTRKVFKETVPLYDVDEFILNIEHPDKHEASMEIYDIFFKVLPSLKKMTLDLPEGYEEFPDPFRFPNPSSTWLRTLEELTLRPQIEMEFQTLLEELASRLPNLKRLNFYNIPGVWKRHIGEYQVQSDNLKLETLVIDVVDIISKTDNAIEAGEDFFVVETEFVSNSEKRQLYKVDLDVTTVTEIVDADLKGLTRGENYIRLHVIVKKLQCLVLADLKNHRADSIDFKEFSHVKLYFDDW